MSIANNNSLVITKNTREGKVPSNLTRLAGNCIINNGHSDRSFTFSEIILFSVSQILLSVKGRKRSLFLQTQIVEWKIQDSKYWLVVFKSQYFQTRLQKCVNTLNVSI